MPAVESDIEDLLTKITPEGNRALNASQRYTLPYKAIVSQGGQHSIH